MIIGRSGDYVENGDFETGIILPWTGTGEITTEYKHSGIYGIDLMDKYIQQVFPFGIPKSDILSFGLYALGSGNITVTLYFSDSTNSYASVGAGYPYDEWHYHNILTWVKNPCTGELLFPATKSVSSIKIEGMYGTIYVDDVVLEVSAFRSISFQETQECNPSIQDIPTSSSGSYVNTDNFILRARMLNITLRLTDAEKTALQTIFDNSTSITLIASIDDESNAWTYDVWLASKPLIYEYVKEDSGNIKEWKADLEFKVRSFSYSGSGYSESDDVITIDGNNFNHIIDTSFVEKSDVFEPEFLNQDSVTLDEDVWNRSPLYVTYTLRTSSLGRWELDQLLLAHSIVNLTDSKYGINNNVWVKSIIVKWTGDINWAKPWEIQIGLIVIL